MAADELLTVRREVREKAVIVHVAGEVDLVTARQLGQELAGIEHAMPPDVLRVVDTTGVTFLASAGLSLLVDLEQRCTDAGVELRIVAGNRSVRRTLALSGLTAILTVVDDLAAALTPAT